jgi:hypothetical protein
MALRGETMPQLSVPSLPIDGPSAWVRADVRPEDWRVELSAACLDEIRRVVDELRAYPLPTIVLGPDDFAMPACREAMARARGILARGVRFAIVERLPMAEMNAAEATAIYWLLSGMIARPVAQKLDGTLIYDVLDTGQQALPGSGVRPDKTNIEIRFHNDNAYNETPPDYVGLLCLRKAMSGGHSRVISFHTAHNALLARFPERLARLYEPFWFDRQREFHPGESPIFAAPVFAGGAEIKARFSVHQINSGYALKGEPLDAAGATAVSTTNCICPGSRSKSIDSASSSKISSIACPRPQPHRLHRLPRARSPTASRAPVAARRRKARLSGVRAVTESQ